MLRHRLRETHPWPAQLYQGLDPPYIGVYVFLRHEVEKW